MAGKVSTVRIKHVDINETRVRAIVRPAEPERERRARIISAEGEMQVAAALRGSADAFALAAGDAARYLQTLGTIATDKSNMISPPLPMDLRSGVFPAGQQQVRV